MSVIPSFSPLTAASLSVPISGVAQWATVIDEPNVNGGGLSANDLGSSGLPHIIRASQITDVRKLVFRRATTVSGSVLPFGTSLRVRLVYPTTVTTSTADLVTPVVKLFAGQSADKAKMTVARNLLGDKSVHFPVDPAVDNISTIQLGTGEDELKVATPDNMAHTWDCDGYEYFLFGVERAWSYTGGPGAVMLQAKFV